MSEMVIKIPGRADWKAGVVGLINGIEYITLSVTHDEEGTTAVLRQYSEWLEATLVMSPGTELKLSEGSRITAEPGDTIAEFLNRIRSLLLAKLT